MVHKNFRAKVVFLLIVTMIVVLSACRSDSDGNTDANGSAAAPAAGSSAVQAGSSGSETPTESSGDSEPVELVVAHFGPIGSIIDNTHTAFTDEMVAQGEQFGLTAKLYGASTLISEPDSFEAVTEGRVDIVSFVSTYFSSFIPEFEALTVPGVYPDLEYQVLEDALVGPVNEILADYGLIMLTIYGTSSDYVVVAQNTITDPANDYKGKVVRASGKYNGEAVSRWGGAPANMAVSEVPTALERKTIDMVLTALSAADGFKMYEVAPYVTRTGLGEPFGGLVMNLEKWDSLSGDQQEAIKKASQTFKEYGYETLSSWETEVLSRYEADGVEVYQATTDDVVYYREVANAIIDEQIVPSANEKGLKLIEALKSLG